MLGRQVNRKRLFAPAVTLSFTFTIGDNFFQVHVTIYILPLLLPARIDKLIADRGFTPDISFLTIHILTEAVIKSRD